MRWQVRVVPKADVSTRSKQLLDYFVSEQLQRVGYLNAKRSGRLQVDDEFEFCGLHDGKLQRWACCTDEPALGYSPIGTIQSDDRERPHGALYGAVSWSGSEIRNALRFYVVRVVV